MHKRKRQELGFLEKNRKRIWKNHMEEIMNKENNWYNMTEDSTIEGPVGKVPAKTWR